ncbi:cytochrome P450 [Anopheles darlingi]|uniref:Cytochrome P450 n=1 Tax=Anopheles darlingi TaxID=43151 RepID=W5J7Q3_ANODA|nr:cytochrome P450 18a1 [Anopheles darlingi]ETN60006.1 cytochrome P450 [Anopheles darlingi]
MFIDSYLVGLVSKEFHDPLNVRQTLFVFLCALSCVLFLQYLIRLVSQINKLPPGPWGVPIFGYLTFIGHEKHTQYMKLAKKYGSLFSAKLGAQLTVVISDYKIIREAFKTEEFTGRPHSPLLKTIGGFGIINSEGPLWKDQRRFLHEKLRNFGMTVLGNKKHLMESRIMTEVTELLLTLSAVSNESTDLSRYLSVSVSNVICNIIMSVRFSIDDPKFKRFNWLIEEGMRLFGEIHTIDYIPQIQYLPGNINAKNKIAKNREEMFDFYREIIEEHKRTFQTGSIRDIVDAYLAEIETARLEGRDAELFEGKDHEIQMMQVIADLFSAGMETIKTTLLWLNVFMLRHPDAMKRVQDELDQVVGRNRLPKIEDVPYLPITETTILEVMRISSIVPLATTHSPKSDVVINGYTIPAGSYVVPLINSVHMDPNLWDKPDEFNPSRFLDAEGNVHKPDFFIPFGVGRRRCLGDVLARMELFLFFASIMHSYTIVLPENEPLPSLKGIIGVTISPQAFRVKLIPRPLQTPLEKNRCTSNIYY